MKAIGWIRAASVSALILAVGMGCAPTQGRLGHGGAQDELRQVVRTYNFGPFSLTPIDWDEEDERTDDSD